MEVNKLKLRKNRKSIFKAILKQIIKKIHLKKTNLIYKKINTKKLMDKLKAVGL